MLVGAVGDTERVLEEIDLISERFMLARSVYWKRHSRSGESWETRGRNVRRVNDSRGIDCRRSHFETFFEGWSC